MTTHSPHSNIEITTRTCARMLSREVAEALDSYHFRHALFDAGVRLRYDDQGVRSIDPPLIAHAPFERHRVYTGTRESGAYNHHAHLGRFGGRLVLAWSNGRLDEEAEGQRVLLSWSKDGSNWSEPTTVVGGDPDTTVAHNCITVHGTDDTLYVGAMCEDMLKDAAVPGMRRVAPDSQRVHLYASSDGQSWSKAFSFSEELLWIFETPTLTNEGRFLGVAATRNGPAMLLWPGDDLCAHPQQIPVPVPAGAAFPYAESTWYQTDDGTIVMFWRDEGRSCRVWVNTSSNGGSTWSDPLMSDIPDCMSRIAACRLDDGRYALVNNAFPRLCNREHLMLLLSDTGYEFNSVQVLLNDPTSNRVVGLLKDNGYQYPCCLADGGRLLVAYSINKEDIECGIVE